MKYLLLILGAVVLVSTALFFVMTAREPTPPARAAASFAECVVLGNPVMESYPRQCIDAVGNHFTERILEEEPDVTREDVREVAGSGNYEDLISVSSPEPRAVIASPLIIAGEARGTWYFEATFPIALVDWDGRIIAETYAEANGEWMTEEFVPFTSTVTFDVPYATSTEVQEFMRRGWLILKKANASDLPEHDAAIEIPVRFDAGGLDSESIYVI